MRVMIKVVCCCPEKLRIELMICKGGKTIKSIDIKSPQKKHQPSREVTMIPLMFLPP
ncbi:unnamed protein product, partial [Vitis vinifera]